MWQADRIDVSGGFRLNSRDGFDFLLLTITDEVTGVISYAGTEFLVSGDASEIIVREAEHFDEIAPLTAPPQPMIDADLVPDGSLDILVLYTKSAVAEAGGVATLEQSLADFVVATQGYFEASETGVSAALAGVMPVEDNETSDIVRTLVELTFLDGDPDLGTGAQTAKFDQAHCLRGESGADLVVLVTGDEGSSVVGVAWVLDESPENRALAFAVTEWLSGPMTLAHEVGHLLGNGHDAENNPNHLGRAPYAQGYRIPGVARTLMAYPCQIPFPGGPPCPRIGIYSNPDLKYDGNPMGDPLSADASRSLDEGWASVTGWGVNEPPELEAAEVTREPEDPGRYRFQASGLDKTSCSGNLIVDPGDGRAPVTTVWSSQATSFEVSLEVTYEEPEIITATVCLEDVQGAQGCAQPIEMAVCFGSSTFADVTPGSPFDADIGWVACHDIAEGFPDGGYHPAHPVSRQAMAAFMYRLAGEPVFVPPEVPTFSDVTASHPFFNEIEWMVAEGISSGYADGRFHPARDVSRMAMAAFMYRLAGEPVFVPPEVPTFSDVTASHPFFSEIEWLAEEGVSGGFVDGTFRPTNSGSRQAMAAFLRRLGALLQP